MRKTTKAIVALSIAALTSSAGALAGEIGYTGSSTVGKFIADASTSYKGSSIKSDTRPESSGGESCPLRAACDFGGVARVVKQAVLDQGVVATLIGKDAIAVVVNVDNPVKELSGNQIKGIFTGQIKNWSEVGGPDLAITTYVVKKGSATRMVMQAKVLGGADYEGATVVTPDAKIIPTVGRDKGAIGQISFAFLSGKSNIRPLAIDGQAASVDNPQYPITRPLYLTTKGTPAGEVKAFVDWALSADGQAVIKQRFIGVN